ncbi:MAG TPA: flagellar basal body P-ring formation chaperone FlgA [Bryobacteraceae bacterium]|nr:flagellar basal body P-ring formation chaperone FlgA [Bryobacteraceae bacterium]
MRLLLLIGMLASLAHAGCVAVSSDRITAADLSPTIAVFETLDPTTPLGFAPLPGTQRILSPGEVSLVAQRNGLALDGIVSPICVQRLTHPISRSELETALIAALGVPDAKLEMVEFSGQPVPPGRFEFQRSGLGKPAAGLGSDSPVLWRGRLLYDGQRSMAIWAKVRITVIGRQFVATEAISAGVAIRAEQVKEIETRQFPFLEPTPAAIGDIAGKIARRNIAAGEKILMRVLEAPQQVRSGEPVHVKVVDGLTMLSFDAIAQGGGKTGDPIWVRNPASGKTFRAVIEQKGKVVVRTAPGD